MIKLTEEDIEAVTDIKSALQLITKKMAVADEVARNAEALRAASEQVGKKLDAVNIEKITAAKNGAVKTVEAARDEAIQVVISFYSAKKDLITSGIVGGASGLVVAILALKFFH